jgi:HSP20 family molecular chaperone IbpA
METRLSKQSAERVAPTTDRPVVRPAVDVFESEEEILLIADLPGVSSERLTIHVEKDDVTVEATSALSGLGDDTTPLLREFGVVEYRRSFVLPRGIDRERISADLDAGVLRLHLPKAENVKPRRIPVTAA